MRKLKCIGSDPGSRFESKLGSDPISNDPIPAGPPPALYVLVLSLSSLMMCATAMATDVGGIVPGPLDAGTPVVVNGDRVEYDQQNKVVIGEGNVSITYGDMKLTCDRIIVQAEEKTGRAEGNVRLYQEGNVFSAERVEYNFVTKKGKLVEGSMDAPPWFGKCPVIEKAGDKEYQLRDSYVTTCNRIPPHYRVRSKTIKVFLGDRVTAWNVIFYVYNVPVMYAPYYNHPLKDNLPQVDIVPGYNDEWGAYLLSAWRYYFHPDSRGHVRFDWRQRRGFGEGVDYKYGLRKFGNGYARFYYIDDQDPPDGTGAHRWRGQLRHRWNVDDNTVFIAEYHRLSDRDFIKDFFYREEYEEEHRPPTFLSLVSSDGNYTMSVTAEPRVNSFFTVAERIPEARMTIRKLRLFNHMNLYLKNETTAGYYKQSYGNDSDKADDGVRTGYETARIDTYNEFSYPFKAFGFLNVTPSVGARQTWYGEDRLGEDNRLRTIYSTGLDLYARFYKILDYETNWMDLDIHDLRHVVIPSARYFYVREPSLDHKSLKQFDEIDTLDLEHGVALALENKLQTRRSGGGKRTGVVDLVRFILETEYVIARDNDETRLGDISADLEIKPYDWLYVEGDAVFNREKRAFDEINADFVMRESEDLEYAMGGRYERSEHFQVTSDLTYRFHRKWKLKAYHRYEFNENKFEEQEYTIVRDMHCWLGEASVNIRELKDYTFWLIFRLKAFPDIPFSFKTTYRGPEPGAKRYRFK